MVSVPFAASVTPDTVIVQGPDPVVAEIEPVLAVV
jgi:hypothetical protein